MDSFGFDDLEIHWGSSEDQSALPDETIQSVITSPPYWDLKDYGHQNEIGTPDESYDAYLDRLDAVWSECFDKLKEGGTMWVVVDTVMERGDLRLLPHHIATRAEEIGFELRDMILWHKPTAIAGMTPRNVVNKKEYIVFLSKGQPRLNTEVTVAGPEDPAEKTGERLGNIWRVPVKRGTAGGSVLHKAPYPIELVNRVVRVSTSEGEHVLDPFMGSGTTAYAALDLGRQCTGFEINEEFRSVIEDRLSSLNQQTLSRY